MLGCRGGGTQAMIPVLEQMSEEETLGGVLFLEVDAIFEPKPMWPEVSKRQIRAFLPGLLIAPFSELGAGFKHFLCSSLPRDMIHFEEHIFQVGWFNHQLVFQNAPERGKKTRLFVGACCSLKSLCYLEDFRWKNNEGAPGKNSGFVWFMDF